MSLLNISPNISPSVSITVAVIQAAHPSSVDNRSGLLMGLLNSLSSNPLITLYPQWYVLTHQFYSITFLIKKTLKRRKTSLTWTIKIWKSGLPHISVPMLHPLSPLLTPATLAGLHLPYSHLSGLLHRYSDFLFFRSRLSRQL